MPDNVKYVTLRDPKTNDILVPRIAGTLSYETVDDKPVAPFVSDADTLQGHPASDFVLADTSDKPTIPAVGETVEWKGYTWRVVHDDGKLAYLMTDAILELIQFSSNSNNTGYLGSKIHQRCLKFAADADISNCAFVADIMGGKVFIAGYDQAKGEFSYFSSDSNRIAYYNGSAQNWWTSSPGSSGNVWRVYALGGLGNDGGPNSTNGFRPCVAIIK